MYLPDGGYAAVAERAGVLYFNADGTKRLQIDNLAFTNMTTTPVVGPDGSLFFTGEVPNDATKNIDQDGDSDGTTIVVAADITTASQSTFEQAEQANLVYPGVNKASEVSAFLKEYLGLIYCHGIYALMY